MHDPLREGVPESINICKEAVIKVRMITGDNYATAVFIAQKVGILPSDEYQKEGNLQVMSG